MISGERESKQTYEIWREKVPKGGFAAEYYV